MNLAVVALAVVLAAAAPAPPSPPAQRTDTGGAPSTTAVAAAAATSTAAPATTSIAAPAAADAAGPASITLPKEPRTKAVTLERRVVGGRCVERLRVRSAALGAVVPVDVVLPAVEPAAAGRLPAMTLLGGMSLAKRGPEVSMQYWTGLIDLGYVLDAVEAAAPPPPTAAGIPADLLPAVQGAWAKSASRPRALYVLPHTDVSPRRAAWQRYVAEELVALVDARYPTRATRSARGIDGLCLGGAAALLVALGRPDVYGMAGAVQPAMEYSQSINERLQQLRAAGTTPPYLHVITSTRDIYRAPIVAWRPTLQLVARHEFHEYIGGHNMPFYEKVGGPLMLVRFLAWFGSGDEQPAW